MGKHLHKEGLKNCYICKQIKPRTKFYFYLSKKGKWCSSCIECKKKERQRIRIKKFSNSWWSDKYSRIKSRAKIRGIQFNLSKDDFKSLRKHSTCFYCGIAKLPFITIDRKNNNRGYTTDNCIQCCHWCNRTKGRKFSFEEMIILGKTLNDIYRKRNKKVV
jgi:hypothetical protein